MTTTETETRCLECDICGTLHQDLALRDINGLAVCDECVLLTDTLIEDDALDAGPTPPAPATGKEG
jgi:hypothetical protein